MKKFSKTYENVTEIREDTLICVEVRNDSNPGTGWKTFWYKDSMIYDRIEDEFDVLEMLMRMKERGIDLKQDILSIYLSSDEDTIESFGLDRDFDSFDDFLKVLKTENIEYTSRINDKEVDI